MPGQTKGGKAHKIGRWSRKASNAGQERRTQRNKINAIKRLQRRAEDNPSPQRDRRIAVAQSSVFKTHRQKRLLERHGLA